jgi:hypothetical protein
MTLEEQTIKEIKQLPPHYLTLVYNHILLLKGSQAPCGRKQLAPYLKARHILSKSRVSLSEDIINSREDRI